MLERIKQEAAEALHQGYDGVLGLVKKWGQVGPHLFRDPEQLQDLEIEPRYALSNTLRVMLKRRPDLHIAAVVRGCDVRALRELEKKGDLTTEGIRFIGIECSAEQARECNCEKPYYETLDCTGCWKCLEACPEKAIERINVCPIVVPNEFDMNLGSRKAVYIPYAQAVPLKATRDAQNCLKIRDELDCKGCENACQAGAILHADEDRIEEIEVGSDPNAKESH